MYDVIIIGAGTAGLTARREVARHTDNYLIVDDGPLGTTCARVGCMPSKVLIQVANDFYRQKTFDQVGISGSLSIDHDKVMQHVRSLRDRFVRGVKGSMGDWESKLVRGRAVFHDSNTILVNEQKYQAKKFIVAIGSTPIVPKPWQEFSSHLVTTDQFFELEQLPKRVAVIGLGVIGIELGQALHRIGVDVVGIGSGPSIGGLSDPEIQDYVRDRFSKEMNLSFEGAEIIGIDENNQLQVKTGAEITTVDKALIAIGRRPQVDKIGLDKLGVSLNERGLPEFDKNTLALTEAPHIFFPGDVNADRPILHEAADEGQIAGYNAVHDVQCFKRRTPLGITFSEPNIATIGKRHSELVAEKVDFKTGHVSFEGQGRSIVKLKEQGLLHVYVDSNSGKLLGCELHGPDGEHLAHLLAWAMSMDMTVFEALKMPFYHPVVEEGLRTALRDAAQQMGSEMELLRCNDAPIR